MFTVNLKDGTVVETFESIDVANSFCNELLYGGVVAYIDQVV